ncbi:MAG: hypothetical protein E6Q88_11515 [Lysobacteraceae bacterium]|nr:MAG: hypothetical protein E6Q88_11515 [Xanthomonadaceae bacterium]
MATSKKSASKTAKTSTRAAAKSKTFALSIDLGALDRLYKNRYVITLDGGDTKGGSVRLRDGDTKGGLTIRGPERILNPKPAAKTAKKRAAKKTAAKKA